MYGDLYTAKKIPVLSYVNDNIEVCMVEICFRSESIIIISIYRPHSGTVHNFINELGKIFNFRDVCSRRCILAGDLNINLCSDNIDVNIFTDHMYSYHCIPVIRKPTRFPANNFSQPTLLDQIWGNKLTAYSSFIVLHYATDHCPTLF